MASEEISLKITAKDEASKVVDALAKKVNKLDGETAEIEFKADTKAAKRDLDDVLAITRRLDGDAATMVLNVRAKEAKRELRDVATDLAHMDSDDINVEIKLAHAAQLNEELDHIQAELKKIDQTTATAKVAVTGPKGKIANILEQTGVTKALDSFGVSAGTAATVAATAITGAAVKVLGDAARKFADLARDVEKFAQVSGLGADAASRFVAVADDYGVGADVIAKAVGKLGGTLGKNIDALDQWGIAVATTKDGSVDLTETFFNVVDALNSATDPAEKNAIAMATFGKSWQELIPLIDVGSATIKESFKGIDKQQLMSPAKLEQAKKFGLAMDNLGDKALDLQLVLGEKLGPALVGTADGFTKIAAAGAPAVAAIFDFGVKAIRNSPLGGLVDLLNGPGGFNDAVGTTSANVDDATAAQLLWNRQMREGKGNTDELDTELSDQLDTWKEQADAVDQATQAVSDYNTVLASADFKAAGLTGATQAMEQFATAQFGATDAIIDIESATDDLGDALKEVDFKKFSKPIDLSTEKGRKAQQSLENLANAIDTQLAGAFRDSHGDFETFRQDGEKIIKQTLAPLKEQFGLTDTEVANLRKQLGDTAGDFEVKFKLSMDATAETKLQLLSGVLGNLDAETQATVVADVIAGDPQKALADIQAGIEKAKLEVVLKPAAPETQAVIDAVDQMQRDINSIPVPTVPTSAAVPTDWPRVVTETNKFFAQNPAVLPVKLGDVGFMKQDAGGTTPYPGGIAGERRPEIINERYLVTGPTWVPPGTRVTGGAKTARILRTHGGRGLKRYDAGGVVPRLTNVTINAAVIGSTFDVMYAVKDAVKRADRLLPRNP